MESLKKNRAIHLNREGIYTLSMCANGFLKPVEYLMGAKEAEEVDATGLYKGVSFPFSFILTPSGRKNREVLSSTHKGEVLNIVHKGKNYGWIVVDEVFRIDREKRFKKLMGGDFTSARAKSVYSALGEYAISGDFHISPLQNICEVHSSIQEHKELLQAKKITTLILQANPLHRVHEQIIRTAYDNSDLLVLFLLKPHSSTSTVIPFKLRMKMLQHTISHYFLPNKLLVFPMENTLLSGGANRIILDAIIAQNIGCTDIITGTNHIGLSLYYENKKKRTIFDMLHGINIKIKVLSEQVYCNQCSNIVSIDGCPHGHFHHIHYRAKSLLDLYKLGIPPPTILVRKEISAMILSHLFLNRFKRIEQLYYDIVPSTSMLNEYDDEKFYLKLLSLYQSHLID